MHMHHDHNEHRNLKVEEEPLDSANQSLADALLSSFGILKAIMVILVILYLASNVRTIGASEQALVLRLGKLLPDVHDPGLVWAWPFPIDEIVPLPTQKSNDTIVTSHSFHRARKEANLALAFISRGDSDGLDPSLDGALLTADAGLVHLKWKITYKIDDVGGYISMIAGDDVESADDLIRILVENIGIHVAAELTAEEVIRTRLDHVQREMKSRLNDKLADLGAGVTVSLVEGFEQTPPLQIRGAFDGTQRAENSKRAVIRSAEQAETKVLNEAAGAAHQSLVDAMNRLDAAKESGQSTVALAAEVDRILMEEVEGEAGRIIKDSDTLMSVIVDQMQSDVELYRTLLPEYERNPNLLITRLWESTRQSIFGEAGVTKIVVPPGTQFRIQLGLDPEEERIEEERRLQEQQFDPSKLRPQKLVPVGPGLG